MISAPEAKSDQPVRLAEQLVVAYRPLHRVFMITTLCYYSFITTAHFFDEKGWPLVVLATLSAATVLASFVAWRLVAKRNLRVGTIELLTASVHVLMIANVGAYQFVHYEPAKLIYFTLLSVAFALSSVTVRTAVATVLMSMALMFAVVYTFDPASLGSYVYIAIASGVTAIGLSIFLRGIIRREVSARLHSEAAEAASRELATTNARLANADFLTGLPNRRALSMRLDDVLGNGGQVTLGILDLDGFKGVNDAMGHLAGDRVLSEVARRLQKSCGPGRIVHRIGGDEFAFLAEGEQDRDAILRRCAHMLEELRQPIHIDSIIASLSGSVGIAQSRPGDTAETLLDRADYAAYEAKTHRRGGTVLFSPEHEERIEVIRQIERELLHARLETEIVPVFQPIVDSVTGQVRSYEALARWRSPALGDVSPATFIPIAERLGVVPSITQSMLRHAIAFASRLPDNIRVSVNLSVYDLASLDAMRNLSRILAASPCRPCRVDFEITETAVMRDIGEAIEALLIVMAHGCRIALDDFGVGHSSLSRVQLLPLDRIKIDRAFVREIQTNRASQAIVKTVLDLCSNLGITCVIEGVETVEELRTLNSLGATLIQGFLFGRPSSPEHILAAMSDTSETSAVA